MRALEVFGSLHSACLLISRGDIKFQFQCGAAGGFPRKKPSSFHSRPGPLQGSGHVHLLTCFQECARILLPRCFVKIGGQEETGLIPKHRIDAHHEFPTLVVVTAEMPTNYFVGYAKKTLVRTFGALDSRFLANSPDPLIAASWRIASSACLTAFEALRINILSSMKQRAEESNFGLGG